MNGPEQPDVRASGIREVARLARVSPATVSRVVNGAPSVQADHRRRVLDAVAKTDYRPNRLARGLRRQKAEAIGVVVSDIENPHFSEAVRVFEDAAYRAGYRVHLCNTDEEPDKQRAYLEVLSDEQVLGVIIAPADRRGTGLEPLFARNTPIVAFDRMIDDPRADLVAWDNVEATRRATEHLIWLEHERIAYVGGRPDVETGADRLEGYTLAMRAAGLTPFAVNGEFRADAAECEVEALLAHSPTPTALLVGNNLMTIGALRAIRRTIRRIPEDIALVAIDDPPWAELVSPAITTVAQPVRKMAATAVEFLLERIEERRSELRRVQMPIEIRIRESCGARGQTAA